jgi:tetraprenyl-beta-curcumene synthase
VRGPSQGDSSPLSGPQLRALAGATARELAWGHRRATREIRHWRREAERIPDRPLRDDALRALRTKRGNVVGAALFSTLTERRSEALVRALATFQAIFDYLDDLNESHVARENGRQVHQALIDALDPERPLADYYAHHPWRDDGGYLAAMVERCREACLALPSYEAVRPALVQEASRAREVLAINHEPDPEKRARDLRRWADEEFPARKGYRDFELAAAASGQLMIFGLLALTAEPGRGQRDVAATYRGYWPLLPLTLTMLDSFVDLAEDTRGGEHRYLSHYGDLDAGIERLAELTGEAMRGLLAMPNGHRQAVVGSCMIAFYLSKDSARAPGLGGHRRRFVRAGGSLTRLLAPVLRAWRLVNAQTAA